MKRFIAILLASVIILMAGPSPGTYKPGDKNTTVQTCHFEKGDFKKGNALSFYAEQSLEIKAPPVYKKESDLVHAEKSFKPAADLRNKGPSIETLRTQLILLNS